MTEERDISYRIQRESEAARDLLAAIGDDDEATLHDMIEGETGLLEALTTAVCIIDEAEAQIAGCKDREKVFADRRAQAERRISRIRSQIEQAIAFVDVQTWKLPTATLTIKAVPPKPIYDDEAAIPARFWRAGDPKIDKSAIADAIKAGEEIPGITMSNGSISLQIRRV